MAEARRRRALITRPQEDSADIAVALARRGVTPILAPMMTIRISNAEIAADVNGAQAILFTSRNGVRAFCRQSQRRDIDVFAVGDSTATLARDNGFATVESAAGDSDALARLVREKLRPADGPLFHPAGADVAGSLAETLSAAGFRVLRRTLYEAVPIEELTSQTRTALETGELDYILFFSPRTARIFSERVTDAGLGQTCARLRAVCLSDAVSAELDAAAWGGVHVAAEPTTPALLAVLDELEKTAAEEPPKPAPGRTQLPWGPRGGESIPPPPPFLLETPDDEETPPPVRGWVSATRSGTLPDDASGPDPDASPAADTAADIGADATAPPDAPPESGPEPPAGPEPEPEPEEPAGPEPPPEAPPPPVLVGEPFDPSPDPTSGPRPGDDQEEMPAPADDTAPDDGQDDDDAEKQETPMTQNDEKPEELQDEEPGVGPPPPPPPPPPARRRGGLAGVAWTLVVVLIAIGAAYVTLPYWRDRLPDTVRQRLAGLDANRITALQDELAAARRSAGSAAAELSDLKARNAELSGKIDEIGGRLAAFSDVAARLEKSEAAVEELRRTGGAAADEAAVAERIAKIERAVADAEARMTESGRQDRAATQALAGDLGAVAQRVETLEARLRALQSAAASAERTDALGLAIGQMRDALARSAPFESELATLGRVAGDRPAIAQALDPVRAYAADGIPTRAALLTRLPATTENAVKALRRPSDESWIERAKTTLRDFVTVRRIDGKGEGADAAIARAEIAAASGDLETAVQELETLQGGAAIAAGPWLKAARARLAADGARAALNRIVLSGVAGGG